MSEEVTSTATETIKQTSDGMVKITLEKYNELVETVANQSGTISSLRGQLSKLRNDPPVIHRTVIQKTAEMAADDNRMWGGTLMGLGAASFVVGVFRYKAGRS